MRLLVLAVFGTILGFYVGALGSLLLETRPAHVDVEEAAPAIEVWCLDLWHWPFTEFGLPDDCHYRVEV